MTTIDINKAAWDGDYDWPEAGDEWSRAWGGPYMQWNGVLRPRINQHIPAKRIVEIACGYGRWTQYLKDYCEELIVVDLSEECIEACKKRFRDCDHIQYFVNDGKSLEFVESSTTDFIFSFDSLVHADEGVLSAYMAEFSRILTSKGTAFIHHSNLAEYINRLVLARRRPWMKKIYGGLGLLDRNLHWRDESVSASIVKNLAESAGLACVSQELVTWGNGKMMLDCMTSLAKSNNENKNESRFYKNYKFMEEASNLSKLSMLYDPSKLEK